MAELGARYNAFSLSEPSVTVGAAIERVGQAADSSYIATEELSSTLGATFAEPMRESSQFAGVVRNVLRYRIMKRIQEEMTKDEIASKRQFLESLEKSELEAKRIDQYLSSAGSPAGTPKRANSTASTRSVQSNGETKRDGEESSVDSDFPPTHGEAGQSRSTPVSPARERSKSGSGGGFVANKIFGRISHAVHGIVDVDPERTRRDQIGKTKESLVHLEQALTVSEQDVKDASVGVMTDLKRFQSEKEDDLKRYMVSQDASPFSTRD